MVPLRVLAYSASLAASVAGPSQRGRVHSVFAAAANILFPHDFVLSLNAITSPRMPNGLQLSALPGSFPFSALRVGMPVLLGAYRLHIEAIGCSLDLSHRPQWNPFIERPASLDRDIIGRNRERLGRYVERWRQAQTPPSPTAPQATPTRGVVGARGIVGAGNAAITEFAASLCGRGPGLTPTGDDILAGWMAVNWLLYGPEPALLEAYQQILAIARYQTHLLSQMWLGYAAQGAVALPIRGLLSALTNDDEDHLISAIEEVLAMGATSGYDVIMGILLGLDTWLS